MSSSICNSILLKSSFKNRGILLNNFKITIFCCIVCKLGANAHFIPKACAIYNETIDLRIHNVIIESTSKIILMLLLQSKALQVCHGKRKLNSEACVQCNYAPDTIRFKHVYLSYHVQGTNAPVPTLEYRWCTNILDTSRIQIKPADVLLLTKGPMSCPL